MKTVLVVTQNLTHRTLYEAGLKKHFAVEFGPGVGGHRKLDAVVYDLWESLTTIDLRWLKKLDLPVVVLSPAEGLRALQNEKRRVLIYPVSVHEVITALADLGVSPEGGGLVS